MLKFAIICAVFLISALSYYRIHHEINITTDVIGSEKQQHLETVKKWLKWSLVASGILVLLCGYDLIYVEGSDKFLGSGCGCSKGITIQNSEIPDFIPMSGMMNPYELGEY